MDLCFVIDSSGSIRDNNPSDGSFDNYELQLQFLTSLVNAFTIGSDATRVGAILFSEQVSLQFALDTYDTAEAINAALLALPYLGQTTNTPEAMLQTRTQCFNSVNGDRPDVNNLAIVVTDGVPFPDSRRSPALDEAMALKDSGATVISIGITDNIDVDFLREMSSPPQLEGQNYFTATDFNALQQIQSTVVEGTCTTLEGTVKRFFSSVFPLVRSRLEFLQTERGHIDILALGIVYMCVKWKSYHFLESASSFWLRNN